MKTTDNSVEESRKKLPIYLLIPIALVQSQMYWLCSVLCCAFKESKIHHEQKPTITTRNRIRAQSDPQTTKSIKITLPSPPPLQRRLSEPTDCKRESIPCIRDRPSVQDELTGTTCPPIWWQKTKFKLRQSPAHSKATKAVSIEKTELLPMPRTITNDSYSSAESKHSKRRNIFKLFHRK
ncbi:hypothetical protein G6F56_002630 [Rhizopus delemar]|nr:hypothetical protein G6F56_002630 [Rhizopus delemar]